MLVIECVHLEVDEIVAELHLCGMAYTKKSKQSKTLVGTERTPTYLECMEVVCFQEEILDG